MAGLIRTGKISSVNYKSGMVTVTYPDKADSVTAEIPCLTAGEYNMPLVGEQVAVIHLSTGTEDGICLGAVSSENQKPEVTGKGNFHKKLGTAEMQTINGKLSFSDSTGTVSIEDILEMKKKIEGL